MNENEMNSLENQLRSLQPRRPSRGLKRRIFPTSFFEAHRAAALSLRWLTPAAACLFIAMATLHQQNFPLVAAGQDSGWLLASNQTSVTLLPGVHEEGENRVHRATFEWTNRSGFTSTVSSFRRTE